MNILVIENEVKISSFLKQGLEECNHDVQIAIDEQIGLKLASTKKNDLIIIDIVKSVKNSFITVKKLRKELDIQTPIIIISSLNKSDDIIEGLDSGADDYLTKPFKFGELLARIRAVSRRTVTSNKLVDRILKVADIEMDLDSKIVTRSNLEISLTAKEFTLLEFFMKNKNKVLNRVDILENVWDINFDAGTNIVDVYVNYLRKKIDKDFDIKLIQTVVGMGYSLRNI